MSSYLDIWGFITKRGKVYYKTGQLSEKDSLLELLQNGARVVTKRGSFQVFSRTASMRLFPEFLGQKLKSCMQYIIRNSQTFGVLSQNGAEFKKEYLSLVRLLQLDIFYHKTGQRL